jgi:amino acid adenylation domain-containing protein/thioester reductase-like protein
MGGQVRVPAAEQQGRLKQALTAGRPRPASLAGEAVDYGPFRPVVRLIEDQADRHPGRVAACHAGSSLTYAELDELANGLAATAAERGVRKGGLVAVMLVNGLELPVTYLAMMKLGAVFVPLDPAWPGDRLRATLSVLSPTLVLCPADTALPGGYRGERVVVAPGQLQRSAVRPRVPLAPGDLLYGFFTSGTTGVPKCALNRQAGLANRLRFMTRYMAATGQEVVLQNSRHTVDSSLWQLCWPLTTGGRTVVPVQGEFLDLPHTIDTIGQYAVTHTDFVSSIFNVLTDIVDTDEAARRKLATLRHIVVGSEEINPRAVQRFLARLPQVQVTNGYGPTETAIGMVFHPVSAADGDVIPLGTPIDNCYVAVTGGGGLLPRGSVGEIVIGGACMGAGYHGDPAATARAFVANRFAGQIPGERLYLTGDLGWLDDRGRLHFAGRKDSQVKIGGVRIELAEIEMAAQRCPGVRQAKAMVTERDGRRALALAVAGNDGLTDAGLRSELRRSLPRTSMPQHFLVLRAMPLADGGKVDTRALRALLGQRLAAAAGGSAPGGNGAGPAGHGSAVPSAAGRDGAVAAADLPGVVLAAFRAALGQPWLTAETDFMAAGGDSIQALLAMRDLARRCAVELSVQDLLDNPAAAQLAALIEGRRGGGAAQEETVLMERDSAVSARLPARAVGRAARLRTVLVTGATGFVGSRLVYDLLTRTDLRVWCLTRATDDEAARQRVIVSMTGRGLWKTAFGERVEAFAGELGEPGLGLDTRTWRHLARSCDLILHNGALVNFLYGYRAHRPANVTGTATLLRLAMDERPVPLHYVSTLGALQEEAARQREKMAEDFDPVRAQWPRTGYSRSKLVAERYLAQARRRGATVTVLRLGEVMPSQERLYPNPLAMTHLLLSAVHRLGLCPDATMYSDYTPVDYAAARMVAAVTDRAVWGKTLHIFHPASVCFSQVLSSAGAAVARVSCADFLARLHVAAASPGERDLGRLAALLPAPDGRDEAGLRRALSALLADNPALFSKDECQRLERRWRLADADPRGPVRAYLGYLDRFTPRAAATAAPAASGAGPGALAGTAARLAAVPAGPAWRPAPAPTYDAKGRP